MDAQQTSEVREFTTAELDRVNGGKGGGCLRPLQSLLQTLFSMRWWFPSSERCDPPGEGSARRRGGDA